MITIKERNFSTFFEAPFVAYGPDTHYVSPMRGDLARFLSLKNPLFETDTDFTYFTALKDGSPIGRITAHVHHASNKLYDTNHAYFGFFDCANDHNAATALLNAAEQWATSKGHTRIIGNFNLTAMQQAGIVTNGFDNAPFTDQIWNPAHIHKLLEKCGYTRQFPMTTFERQLESTHKKAILPPETREKLLSEGFSFAPISRHTIEDRLEDARNILNSSFRNNPMFVPVSANEFMFQAKDMKWIMDPRISKVVHFEGKAVGAVIAIPDMNPLIKNVRARIGLSFPFHYFRYRAGRDRAVVIFQGVLPEFQRKSVNPLMLNEMINSMVDAGYKTVGGTWIADENKASLRQTEKSGARAVHQLHLFAKDLI